MIFGFFFPAAGTTGLCALAVSAAAAAAVVPNIKSRRLVGNAKLPSTSYGGLLVEGKPWHASEVILQTKLQLARIVRIVARGANGCEGVSVSQF